MQELSIQSYLPIGKKILVHHFVILPFLHASPSVHRKSMKPSGSLQNGCGNSILSFFFLHKSSVKCIRRKKDFTGKDCWIWKGNNFYTVTCTSHKLLNLKSACKSCFNLS